MDQITSITQHTVLTASLNQFTSDDLDQAGGKGANLGELINAGFQVPAGFVITTVAYDYFVHYSHLDRELLNDVQADQPESEAIQSAFISAPFPVEIEASILDAYRRLGGGPVALRSSATTEDLPQAAFAGQQDTYLNVIGEQPLLEGVRRCWGSLWNQRAISYRAHQGIEQAAAKLAVVVQEMVAADSAGVMFTANPVSGARDEILVDANPGLGEAVVSGLVTPDHFVLHEDHGKLEIIERQRGRRELVIQVQPGGGTEQVKNAANDGSYSLSDRLLLKLAQAGLAIQRHFGKPQDVEWAVKDGGIFILQARSITALPEPVPHTNRLVRMLAGMFSEMFPLRPYPLDQSTWISALSAAAVDPLFSLIGISVPSIQHFFIEEDGVVTRFSGKVDMHPTPALLLAPVRLVLLSLRYDPLRFQSDPLLIQARQEALRLEALDLSGMSWQELITLVRQALSLALPLAGEIRRRYYPRALLALGFLRLTLGVMGLGKLFGPLTSAPESSTTAANRALEALADRVRSDPQLARLFNNYSPDRLYEVLSQLPAAEGFLMDFNAFMSLFGHREVVLSSVLQPTWKEAPGLVLGMVQGMAQAGSPIRAEPVWETAHDRLLAHPLMGFSPLRRFMLRLAGTARSLWQVREDTHFDATRILPVLRRTFFELGRRLVNAGVVSAAEDIFHLNMDELQQVGDALPLGPEKTAELRSIVQLRKSRRLSLGNSPVIDPRLYQPADLDREALLTGAPASPGVAEGPVCIITSASEFGRLQPGDVLVAPYTNPAWTPLFQRAAAVVVDGGAAGSHAAIVAREYGLPAVLGTIVGTSRLVDGQRVRVDGSRGLVFASETTIEKPK